MCSCGASQPISPIYHSEETTSQKDCCDTKADNVLSSSKPDILANLEGETSGASGNLISRTLESISSLSGSLTNSPKMTQIVGLSSGIISSMTGENDDDEPANNSANESAVPSNEHSHSTTCQIGGIDVAIKNAIKLDDRPELFKSLDGKCV